MQSGLTQRLLAGLLFITLGTVTGCTSHSQSGAMVQPEDGVVTGGARPLHISAHQTVRFDASLQLVTVDLSHIRELANNLPLDATWDAERLRITVPKNWTLRVALPVRSTYRAAVTPFSIGAKDLPLVEGPFPSGHGNDLFLRTATSGQYNLLVMMPGQKGGHVLDIIRVTDTTSPSITKLS